MKAIITITDLPRQNEGKDRFKVELSFDPPCKVDDACSPAAQKALSIITALVRFSDEAKVKRGAK